jgi:FF domain.
MLEEKGILSSDSKFYKVAHHFVNDPRWKALEDRDRENIFQDYLDDLFQKEKEEKRQKRFIINQKFLLL